MLLEKGRTATGAGVRGACRLTRGRGELRSAGPGRTSGTEPLLPEALGASLDLHANVLISNGPAFTEHRLGGSLYRLLDILLDSARVPPVHKGLHGVIEVWFRKDLEALLTADIPVDDVLDLHRILWRVLHLIHIFDF